MKISKYSLELNRYVANVNEIKKMLVELYEAKEPLLIDHSFSEIADSKVTRGK